MMPMFRNHLPAAHSACGSFVRQIDFKRGPSSFEVSMILSGK